jgi:hypothetical protein
VTADHDGKVFLAVGSHVVLLVVGEVGW